jgi:hypothetical protein
LGPTIEFDIFNSHMQHDFPCKTCAKNALCRRCSIKIFNLKIIAFSKVRKNHNKDPIVKLGSLGHNSLKYYAYISSLCPCIIISMKVTSNCPSLKIILLAIWNLGSVVFAWSILSWIMHKNSFLDHTHFNLWVWYKLLHDSWCNMCFFQL